ncbi:hypothetical protein LINPERHAP1_LOCUS15222 [Linum perenne]
MLRFLYMVMSQISKDMGDTTRAPRIMDWEIVVPKGVPNQKNSYDCGMWVCLWMIFARHPKNYAVIQHCGSYERMRLAKDLIMDPSNYAWNMIHERVSRDTPKFEYVIKQYIEEKIKKDDEIEKMARFYELAERCENDVE